jgi:hypothetical protein
MGPSSLTGGRVQNVQLLLDLASAVFLGPAATAYFGPVLTDPQLSKGNFKEKEKKN